MIKTDRMTLAVLSVSVLGIAVAAEQRVAKSPWGSDDEIGALNMMTAESRADVLSRITGGTVYDLSVEYFKGMPSWSEIGDPVYQYWLTHTPRGTVVDDPASVGLSQNETVSYTGDAITMYTHTGTHIDALNHFGLHGKIFNGYEADKHLGDRGWNKGGAEKLPPIIARGVMIDVASAKQVDMLPPSYQITEHDMKQALAQQNIDINPGDVVLIRTGRMRVFSDAAKFLPNPPGLSLSGARWLAEEKHAMLIGGDNLSLEAFPVADGETWVPVHTYLLAEQGVPIMEVVYLEDLARDRVFEFAFVGAALKLRGASGSPMRPLALPINAHGRNRGKKS